jgi:general stress protein YciG
MAQKRGFAAMPKQRQREIAQKGGLARGRQLREGRTDTH